MMHLKGMTQLMVRAFVIENSSRFIAFCKDEELSEDDFVKPLEEMDFNEIVTPELLANFRL